MNIDDKLTYSMQMKNNKVIKHKKKLNQYKTIELMIFVILLYCVVMYFIKFNFTIVAISLIGFLSYTLVHAEYIKTEKKYDKLRHDIIDTMKESFCYHTDHMCNCREKYIEDMDKVYNIDLAIK